MGTLLSWQEGSLSEVYRNRMKASQCKSELRKDVKE